MTRQHNLRTTSKRKFITMFMIPPVQRERSTSLYERETANVGRVRELTNRDVGPIYALLAGNFFDSHVGCGSSCAEEA